MSLSTRRIILSVKDIPSSWCFQYYCKIQEPLTGQKVRITSLFNPQEKTPSFDIFFDGKYKFKDYSSGKWGDSLDLVCQLYNLTPKEAVAKIIKDYKNYLLTNEPVTEFNCSPTPRFQVVDYKIRGWDKSDAKYWTSFNIGTKQLNKYFVKALDSYTLCKGGESIVIRGVNLYGYFTKSGELYKIYQPLNRDKKFIKISGVKYLQGSQQIKGKGNVLLILSSLKDLMSLKSLGIKVDAISPDSENSIIEPKIIQNYLENYKKVICILDSDSAGVKAMITYKEKYNIDFIIYNKEKDISDAVKKHGWLKVRDELVIKINNKLDGD